MKKLSIEVSSEETEDLVIALEYATQKIKEGYLSGSLNNEHNQGNFDIETID